MALIQLLLNISINLSYAIYLASIWLAPGGTMPRFLPLNLFLLLFIIPGYFALQKIEDRILQWVLLATNIIATVLVWILFTNIARSVYAP